MSERAGMTVDEFAGMVVEVVMNATGTCCEACQKKVLLQVIDRLRLQLVEPTHPIVPTGDLGHLQ